MTLKWVSRTKKLVYRTNNPVCLTKANLLTLGVPALILLTLFSFVFQRQGLHISHQCPVPHDGSLILAAQPGSRRLRRVPHDTSLRLQRAWHPALCRHPGSVQPGHRLREVQAEVLRSRRGERGIPGTALQAGNPKSLLIY